MILSGTLREFILADVFQLLTQQKITGKLILHTGSTDGIVTFREGFIVSAEKGADNLSTKLHNYIKDTKSLPLESITELFKSFGDNLNELSSETIKRGIMSKKEMASFAETIIEDIACSLFQWKAGTYRFSSMHSVESSVIEDISIPVENIVMEAMRRVDEWNRMIDVIKDDMVFIPAEKTIDGFDVDFEPLKNPDLYLLKKIDGTTPVRIFLHTTFLTEYKVYEALNSLYQSKKILILSSKLSKSVQEALNKQSKGKSLIAISTGMSLLTTAAIILLMFSISAIFKRAVIPEKTVDAYVRGVDVPIKNAQQNISIASVYYQAQTGSEPSSIKDLNTIFILSSDDFYFFNLNSKLKYKKNRDVNKKVD